MAINLVISSQNYSYIFQKKHKVIINLTGKAAPKNIKCIALVAAQVSTH